MLLLSPLSGSLSSLAILLSVVPLPIASLPSFSPIPRSSSAIPTNLTVHKVHQFPPGTWIENLAIRASTGGIIATTFNPFPRVYEVDPFSQKPPVLLARIPGVTGVSGIAELERDVFYVAAGNFSWANVSAIAGSWSVWKIDLRVNASKPKTSLVAKLHKAKFLNGMTILSEDQSVLLISDSTIGAVWSCHVHTGFVSKAVADATMKGVPIGINGIKVRDGSLYYTNSANASFHKIPIHLNNGTARGPAVLIASGIPGDDFTFDKLGNAWVAANSNNELEVIPMAAEAAGKVKTAEVVAGSINSTTLEGVTAAQFGNEGILYLSTSGGTKQYITGNYTLGGTISKVRTYS